MSRLAPACLSEVIEMSMWGEQQIRFLRMLHQLNCTDFFFLRRDFVPTYGFRPLCVQHAIYCNMLFTAVLDWCFRCEGHKMNVYVRMCTYNVLTQVTEIQHDWLMQNICPV